jgi:conjugal transfer pilin signal peptidase TrbI
MVWLPLMLALGITVFAVHFTFTINTTPSLPIKVALIERGTWPAKAGDLVAYRSTGAGPVPAGIVFVKRVAGMPGDIVTCEPATDPALHCVTVVRSANGIVTRQPVRRFSRQFMPLAPGPVGVIPDQHYHVAAEHPQSFDSRYALMGWIRADQVVGKVVWAW